MAYSSSTCCWPWPLAVSSTWPKLAHREDGRAERHTQMHGHRSDDFENASGQRGWAPKRHLDATKTCLAFNCKLTNRAGGEATKSLPRCTVQHWKQSSNKTASNKKKTMCTSFPAFARLSPPPPSAYRLTDRQTDESCHTSIPHELRAAPQPLPFLGTERKLVDWIRSRTIEISKKVLLILLQLGFYIKRSYHWFAICCFILDLYQT